MSVIIVGDIDTKQVVKLLKQNLSQENPITKTTLEKLILIFLLSTNGD